LGAARRSTASRANKREESAHVLVSDSGAVSVSDAPSTALP
jgi:hypothetical protein